MQSEVPSHRGKYRIQTVAEMTGVPAATLRAWEKRYGVPTPVRSPGAYRLYSVQDVERVRRMRDLCAAGMAAAQAAELEESTPKHAVTPGPTLPARELLGDLLMEQGRAEAALEAYRRSLALYPNRLNSIRGAERAAPALQ